MRSEENESYLAYTSHLRDEHRHLKECLEHAEHGWRKLPRCRVTSNEIDRLIDGLAELRAVLTRHFAEEEYGGCVEEAVTHAPELKCEAGRLVQEDSRLLEQLDDLIRRLRADSKSIWTVEVDYRLLVRQIRDHADAETRIMETGLRMCED